MNILEVQNLHKSFQEGWGSLEHQVLKGISFTLKPGSITGFLGANGAGKTTLIKILLGFISCNKGKILWGENFGKNYKNIMQHIGYFPERPYFYSNVTGREFLNYTGRLSGIMKSELSSQMEKYAKLLKIDFALDRNIGGYSKGMLQRLGFMSAILHNPSFLIFDEPLSGLDPIGRQEFKDVLLELHSEEKTIFFSSHIVPDIEQVCEDVLFLDEGVISYHGSIKQLLEEHSAGVYDIQYMEKSSGKEKFKEVDSYSHLQQLYQNDQIEILSSMKKRPTLEEIIYRTRRGE